MYICSILKLCVEILSVIYSTDAWAPPPLPLPERLWGNHFNPPLNSWSIAHMPKHYLVPHMALMIKKDYHFIVERCHFPLKIKDHLVNCIYTVKHFVLHNITTPGSKLVNHTNTRQLQNLCLCIKATIMPLLLPYIHI